MQAQIELKQQQVLYSQLNQQLRFTSPQEALAAANISEDPIYTGQVRQLKEIQTQLAIASADLTEDNPQIQSLREKEKNLQALVDKRRQETLRQNDSSSSNPAVLSFQGAARNGLIGQLLGAYNKIKMSENTLRTLQDSKTTLEQQIKRMPLIINKYNDLQTQIAINKQVLNKLLVQRETFKVEEITRPTLADYIETANPHRSGWTTNRRKAWTQKKLTTSNYRRSSFKFTSGHSLRKISE